MRLALGLISRYAQRSLKKGTAHDQPRWICCPYW